MSTTIATLIGPLLIALAGVQTSPEKKPQGKQEATGEPAAAGIAWSTDLAAAESAARVSGLPLFVVFRCER